MVRIVVADDHALVRDTLRRVIEREPDVQIVGEAGTVVSTIDQVRALRPDLLLLDLTMPGGGGIAGLSDIRAASPTTRIVVLTMHDDPAYLRAALSQGAAGFVCKDAAARDLPAAMRAVLQGRTYVDAVMAGAVLKELWSANQPCATGERPQTASNFRASAWNELLAAAVSHDIVNFVVGASADRDTALPDALTGHLDRLQAVGLRLRTLASVGQGAASARIDQTCEDALVEAARLPGQTVTIDAMAPNLRVAAPPAALRTVVVSLLDHAFSTCPDAASVQLAARREGGNVVLEIVARDAWTVGASDNQPLDVLLVTERRDLRGDSSLVIAGAIADALGGRITMTSGRQRGLRLMLYLKDQG